MDFRAERGSRASQCRGLTAAATKEAEMQKRLSLLILAVGLVLVVFMIRTEGEPGALPLLLILVGAGWYLVARRRTRAHR